MSTNKWERQKERKTNAKTARIGNGGEEENKILNKDISQKRGKKVKSSDVYRTRCVYARARKKERKREKIGLPEDKTDFTLAIFSELSFHKSENILRRRYFGIVGNKTQNAFETAPTAPPRCRSTWHGVKENGNSSMQWGNRKRLPR